MNKLRLTGLLLTRLLGLLLMYVSCVQVGYAQQSGGGNYPTGNGVRVKEVDGSPNVPGTQTLVFPNGSLTRAGQTVTVTFAGGTGTTINSSDGYLPYRINSTSFGNSQLNRIDATTLRLSGAGSPEFRLEDTSTANPWMSFYSGGTRQALIQYSGSASRLEIRAENSNDLLLRAGNSNNVGVSNGSFTPAARFHINESTSSMFMITRDATDPNSWWHTISYDPDGVTVLNAGSYTIAPRGPGAKGADFAITTRYPGDPNFVIKKDAGNVGFNTLGPDKAVEINSATGANLRLTYNDADGSAANYADLSMSSGGDLTIAPSGGDTNITGTLAISGALTVASCTGCSGISGLTTGVLPYATSGTALGDSPISRVSSTTVQVAAINGSASANGSLRLQGTSDSTRTTSYVTLQENGGFVGIGVASPAHPLAIVSSQNEIVRVLRSGESSGWVIGQAGSGGAIGLAQGDAFEYDNGGAKKWGIRTKATGDVNFVVSSDGSVGITNATAGVVTSPGAALHLITASGSPIFRQERITGAQANQWDWIISSNPTGSGNSLANGSLSVQPEGAAADFGITTTGTGAVNPSFIVRSTGNIRLGDSAVQVNFAGDTSSFPALKRSSAELQVRLADDSAYTNIAANNLTYAGTPQTLTGAGAVNLTTYATLLVTTAANALTLAAGSEGQFKFIRMKTDGGDGTLTVTNLEGGTTITFNDAGDFVLLFYQDAKWHIITNSGCTVA